MPALGKICFRLQIRDREFNVMFHGGRLFQQWAVDSYVKVESMRLDWAGETKTASLGSGEMETASKGLGETSLICLAPSGEVSVGANFLALGIPNIDTRQI